MGVISLPYRGRADARWGDWRLGDLCAALRRASEVLGPSASVRWVAVAAPATDEGLPSVQIAVDGPAELAAVRDQLVHGEYLPHFVGASQFSFEAEVNDLELLVCRPEPGGPA